MYGNSQYERSQEQEDSIASISGRLQQEPDSLQDNDIDAVWQRFNILSLGYSFCNSYLIYADKYQWQMEGESAVIGVCWPLKS